MLNVLSHRCHDYRRLIERWRAVSRASGVRLRTLARTTDYKIHYLKTKPLGSQGGIYLSAGIHGDEPAGVEALIAWAEKNANHLAQIPCLIFPCLNPWGLVNNRRSEQDSVDLNRSFQLEAHPTIHAIKPLIEPHHFTVSLMLHEDYDAQGIYLYETELTHPFWGEKLIAAGKAFIPVDRRTRIDGRKPLKPGIVRRKIKPKIFTIIGVPEAIHLHLSYSARTFTVETPSEFALDQRVAAHLAIIEECVRLAAKD